MVALCARNDARVSYKKRTHSSDSNVSTGVITSTEFQGALRVWINQHDAEASIQWEVIYAESISRWLRGVTSISTHLSSPKPCHSFAFLATLRRGLGPMFQVWTLTLGFQLSYGLPAVHPVSCAGVLRWERNAPGGKR